MGAHLHVVEIKRTAIGQRTGIPFTCVDTSPPMPAGSIGLADALAQLGGNEAVEVIGATATDGAELEAWEARYLPAFAADVGIEFAIRIAVRPATEADR